MLLNHQETAIRIDCGIHYEEEVYDETDNSCAGAHELYRKNTTFPFVPASLRAFVITHAHTEYCGRLKYLVDQGLNAPVYMTSATQKLAEIMLRNVVRYDESQRNWINSTYRASSARDYLTLQWENCTYATKARYKAYAIGTFCELRQKWKLKLNPCKSFATIALEPVWPRVKAVSYFDPVTVSAHVRFTLVPVYHILGPPSVLFTLVTPDRKRRKVLFSWDIGKDIEMLYKTPQPFPAVDVVVEGTYGNKIRERDYEKQKNLFIRDIAEALREGKIVWIPAFTLDRTQKTLTLINKAKQEKILPASVPAYVPSPTAHEINQLYAQFERSEEFFLDNISQYLAGYRRELPPYRLLKGPAILITTSGMLNQTYSYDLIPHLVPRSDVFLCFVGFQLSVSPGGHIISGARTLNWKEEDGPQREVPVRLSW